MRVAAPRGSPAGQAAASHIRLEPVVPGYGQVAVRPSWGILVLSHFTKRAGPGRSAKNVTALTAAAGEARNALVVEVNQETSRGLR